MVETEGVHAAGFAESDFRKQIEATTPLGRIEVELRDDVIWALGATT